MENPFFPDDNEISWPEIIATHPELGDGLEELTHDPEAGVVAAVGVFTMLKVRFWQRSSASIDPEDEQEHQTDDEPPTQAGSGPSGK